MLTIISKLNFFKKMLKIAFLKFLTFFKKVQFRYNSKYFFNFFFLKKFQKIKDWNFKKFYSETWISIIYYIEEEKHIYMQCIHMYVHIYIHSYTYINKYIRVYKYVIWYLSFILIHTYSYILMKFILKVNMQTLKIYT